MIRTALLVAGKDLRIEVRSRVLLWQVVPFGVIALLLCGLALGPAHAGSSSAGPGLYYLVTLLVTLLMINRSHVVERAPGTKSSIATLGLDPAGVFLGKSLALAVELWLTGLVLLAGAVLVLHTGLHGALIALPSIVVTLGALAAAGTLYGALDRLTSEGLVAPDRDEVESGRLRRYYRLTDEGSARLAEEARRLQESAATALQRLGALRPSLAGGAV